MTLDEIIELLRSMTRSPINDMVNIYYNLTLKDVEAEITKEWK